MLLYDLKHGDDVMHLTSHDIEHDMWNAVRPRSEDGPRCIGLLMAPPCDHFTKSAAWTWAAKDADGRTAAAVALVEKCLDLCLYLGPRWWALENPAGRLPKLVPRLAPKPWYFDPCDFAGYADDPQTDAYTKKTGLWGVFEIPVKARVEPVMFTTKDGAKRGSWMWAKLGGKSARTKELRSTTPQGFSRAFAQANASANSETGG